MKTLLSLCLLLCSSVSAKMVFLVGNDQGMHIGVSDNGSDYKTITSGELMHLYPSISSNGRYLSFSRGVDGFNLELFVKDNFTGEEKRILPPGFNLQSRFSKNGKRLFFSTKVKGKNQIAYVDHLISNDIHFVTKDNNNFFPTPFQSGEMIVYQRNLSKTDKQVVLFDFLRNEELIISKGNSPALSKDERYIAFTKKVEGNWDIYIYDRFKKTTVRATADEANDFAPSFDQYGNLLYTSDRIENGIYSIYKQDFSNWSANNRIENILFSKKGVSFYSPNVTGSLNYSLVQMPDMIGEPRSSFGTINHNNKVYVIGGHQGAEHTYPPESFTGRVTAFDLETNTWSDRAPRPHKAHGYQVTSHGKYIYAFGGFAYEETNLPKWKSLSVVDRYNTETNSWETISHMPRNRSSNVVIKMNDKVYMIGGWDSTPKFDNDIDGTFHDEIDVFDLKTHTWSTLNTKLPKKRRAFSGFVKSGLIYLVGGISEGGSHFSLRDDFTQFDPVTGEFKELAKLPFGTFAPAAGAIGNKAYMFGGMFKTGKWSYEYVPHIYSYDYVTNAWSHTGRFLKEYKGFSQVINVDSCLGVLGGHSYQGNQDKPVDTFEVFCN